MKKETMNYHIKQNDTLEVRQDIEQLLREGNSLCIKPQGYSMYPVLVPGRDEVIIEPVCVEKLRRGDVVLYRRDPVPGGNILVLHRIWKVKPEGFFLVGDNQKEIEGPLRANQMKGIMVGMNRKGRFIPASNPVYRCMTGLWLWLRPVRPVISKAVAAVKSLIKRN